MEKVQPKKVVTIGSHKPAVVKVAKPVAAKKGEHYLEAVGRRKTAVVRVRLHEGGHTPSILVNGKKYDAYFPLPVERKMLTAPFEAADIKNYQVTALAKGGGLHAQAEALRLGISRAILMTTPDMRSRLKAMGFLKRDPRMVETKKFGSRKARRPQQWRKR